VLEVTVVVQHSEVGSFGNGRKYQVACSDRAVPALVGQKQHDLRCTIEVGLMGWDKRERSDQLLADLVRAASAEQSLQLEYAAPANLALLLQIEEQ
jgi:predicted DNA-binding transcriptional regulator YafY